MTGQKLLEEGEALDDGEGSPIVDCSSGTCDGGTCDGDVLEGLDCGEGDIID